MSNNTSTANSQPGKEVREGVGFRVYIRFRVPQGLRFRGCRGFRGFRGVRGLRGKLRG